MGDEDKKARFERIRRQIRESARRAGQLSVAAGILVLTGPAGAAITPDLSPDEVQVEAYDEAAPDTRISRASSMPTGPLAPDQTLREDFEKVFEKAWDKTTPA